MTDYTNFSIPAGWVDETDEYFDPGEGIAIVQKTGAVNASVRLHEGRYMGLVNVSAGAVTGLWGTFRISKITGDDWDLVVAQTAAEAARVAGMNREQLLAEVKKQ